MKGWVDPWEGSENRSRVCADSLLPLLYHPHPIWLRRLLPTHPIWLRRLFCHIAETDDCVSSCFALHRVCWLLVILWHFNVLYSLKKYMHICQHFSSCFFLLLHWISFVSVKPFPFVQANCFRSNDCGICCVSDRFTCWSSSTIDLNTNVIVTALLLVLYNGICLIILLLNNFNMVCWHLFYYIYFKAFTITDILQNLISP